MSANGCSLRVGPKYQLFGQMRSITAAIIPFTFTLSSLEKLSEIKGCVCSGSCLCESEDPIEDSTRETYSISHSCTLNFTHTPGGILKYVQGPIL